MPSQRITMSEFKLQARIEELEEELEAERQARAKVSDHTDHTDQHLVVI